jgi:hypothetical protein
MIFIINSLYAKFVMIIFANSGNSYFWHVDTKISKAICFNIDKYIYHYNIYCLDPHLDLHISINNTPTIAGRIYNNIQTCMP